MSINSKLIWTITDGSEGMISQTNGLAQQFSPNIVNIVTDLILPWSNLQPGFLPVYKWIFKNKFNLSNKPDIIITCGRKSVYASLFLKKFFSTNVITIHIQNPKINSKNFDFVVAPNHDNYEGTNVLNTTGAIHHFTKKIINDCKDIMGIKKKENLVSIILGGSSNHYKFSKNVACDLIKRIKILMNKYDKYSFCILPSRRTTEPIIDLISKELSSMAFIWNKKSKNPYLFCLKASNYFIVTSDSTSMISECAFTGKPVYVYHLPFKRVSKRLLNFHKEFEEKRITRTINTTLDEWGYNSLDEAKRIADIIDTRILNNTII